MDNEIPEDILFQILMRLPVLVLIRFRCVSKDWYALISSFNFINTYNHHSRKQICANYNLMFTKILTYPSKEVFSLHGPDEPFDEIRTFEFPINNVFMAGCVNGLMCLNMVMKNLNTLVLWNPSIRKVLVLPEFEDEPPTIINGCNSNRVSWFRLFDTCFGFGYDALSNDFKVLRMISYGKRSDNGPTIYVSRTSFGVFSVATKSWKTLDFSEPMYTCSQSCNVGRFVYRLSFLLDESVKILSFDLNSEAFDEIALPPNDNPYQQGAKDDLMIYRDSLGLIRGWDYTVYEIWALKNDEEANSWMKMFRVLLDDTSFYVQQIIGFTAKGAMLLIGEGDLVVSPAQEDAHHVVTYVPPSSRINFNQDWQVDQFNETLFLLNDGVDQSLLVDHI